ncbi:MAG: hypothetical protein ACTSU2_08485, partial [Promethearchaeota archaeon]
MTTPFLYSYYTPKGHKTSTFAGVSHPALIKEKGLYLNLKNPIYIKKKVEDGYMRIFDFENNIEHDKALIDILIGYFLGDKERKYKDFIRTQIKKEDDNKTVLRLINIMHTEGNFPQFLDSTAIKRMTHFEPIPSYLKKNESSFIFFDNKEGNVVIKWHSPHFIEFVQNLVKYGHTLEQCPPSKTKYINGAVSPSDLPLYEVGKTINNKEFMNKFYDIMYLFKKLPILTRDIKGCFKNHQRIFGINEDAIGVNGMTKEEYEKLLLTGPKKLMSCKKYDPNSEIKDEFDLMISRSPDTIKPFIQDLIDDWKATTDPKVKNSLFKTLMTYTEKLGLLMENSDAGGGWRSIPYVRPPLADKQYEMMDALDNYSIIFVEGDRRTRKTSTFYRWDFEYGLSLANNGFDKTKTIFIAGSGKLAEAIIDDMVNSEYHKDIKKHVSKTVKKEIQYFNGHKLSVRNTTTSDTKGQDSHVVCVDEADEVFRNNPKVIADLAATALTHDIKVVFLANRPKGEDLASFRSLTEVFYSEQFWVEQMGLSEEDAKKVMGMIKYVKMDMKDIPEMNTEEFKPKKNLVAGIQRVTMGSEYYQSQLEGKDPIAGVNFLPENLSRAYNNYSIFVDRVLKGRYPEYVIVGVDPSGGDHPTGISVLGYLQGFVYEIESFQIEGKENLDTDYIRKTILGKYRQYSANIVVCESNSGGKRLVNWLTNNGCTAINYNIDKFGATHTDLINLMRFLLQKGRIFLKNPILKDQLKRYNPKKSRSTALKGDLA